MAANYDFVSSIAPGKDNWSIVVKVVRLWTVTDLNKPNIQFAMEMVLMDEKVVIHCLQLLFDYVSFLL